MSAEAVIRLSARGLNVEILPDSGGRISAFWSETGGERTDWFVPQPKPGDADSGSTAWGSFPLVPFSNRIRDGRFTWDGEEHRIAASEKNAPHAIHGHGRSVPWDVGDVSETRAALSYTYPGEDWPFPYRARQVFDLVDGALSVSLELENTGTKDMPGGLGHHPYLPWRDGPVLATSFGSIWPAVDGVLPAGPEAVPGDLDFSGSNGRKLPRGLDTGFGSWSGHALVKWRGAGLSLEIDASETLSHVILFTPEGKPFFCVEPVTHCIDAINLDAKGVAGTGIRAVSPEGSLVASMKFRPGVDRR
ncbi:aldose 1-epimerase [Nisaea nitritireducens]|uniref:aldose 1-epimerase n=1 Tax=Nisaea nitritireducens TaxID=568392 RepID=UPI0018693187|nr:aldose 1-epimerase [Nisaea nitritireducens]